MNKHLFDDEQVIYHTGDFADRMYFIKSGHVQLIDDYPETGKCVSATLGPGKIFGEMELIDGSPRTCIAQTRGPVKLISFTQAELKDALFQNPENSLILSRTIFDHLRDLYSGESLESEVEKLRLEMHQTIKQAVVNHEARVVKSHNGMMAMALPVLALVIIGIVLQTVLH